MLSKTAVLLAAIIPSVLGQNANTTATSDVGSSSAFSPTPVTTAVPSATAALNAPVPGQGEYPPLQGWCNNGGPDVYCPGALLQDVQLARIFPDSKTFPDKPTRGTLNETLAAYDALPSNRTIQDIENFVNEYFQGEGLELNQIEIEGFVENPAILDNVEDPVLRGWVSVVNSYWSLLIRETNQTAVCSGPDDCESSLIPLNNTIVVPGGRYREIYYWDSLWIMEGLLHSELYNYAWDLLSNMMDFIEVYGFIPNGGRKYYLNRSQPPVFVQMVDAYVKVTGNYSVLERALPLGSTEMRWWDENRGINVTSPYTGREYFIAHYNVNNTAPRPEGYVEDFLTVHESSPMLNETEQAALYAELATGAESGWDYSVRWCKEKILNLTSNDPALRQLNARAIIPVDLTALLAGDHALLANYYELWANMSQGMGTNSTSANSTSGTNSTMTNSSMGAMGNWSAELAYNRQRAQEFYDATLDLHWDVEKAWFYDFNTTGNDRSEVYTPSGTFPLWQNITPTELTNNETLALAIVSGQRYLLGKYAGLPSVNSLYESGLNWDFPNAWPPTLHTTIKSFETLGRVIANASTLNNLTLAYGGVTQGQLGVNETDIPVQPQSTIGNTSLSVPEAEGKPWPLALSIEYANRYMQAAFCSWYSTGGEIEGLLTQLPISDLNSTGTYTPDQTGVMFEKFNATEPDAAGGGGEYTVQVGFGWTNGVVLWIAGEYGQYLPEPTCPLIPIVEITNSTSAPVTANTTGQSAVRLFQGYRIPRD